MKAGQTLQHCPKNVARLPLPRLSIYDLQSSQLPLSGGIRKIIFWYVAEVDSTARQVLGTQEEGEDFEVRWVRREDAPLRMSFAEDQEIVEKALSAIPRWP